MDDLKIVFYIVVAIIWMVYNNYKKISEQSKRRDPSKPSPETIDENWPSEPSPPSPPIPQKSQQPRSFKRKEYLPKPAPVQKPPVMERKPLYKDRLSSQYKSGTFLPTQREGGYTQPSKIVKFEDVAMEPEWVNELAQDIRNADFRQAIILAEVLKRPYN